MGGGGWPSCIAAPPNKSCTGTPPASARRGVPGAPAMCLPDGAPSCLRRRGWAALLALAVGAPHLRLALQPDAQLGGLSLAVGPHRLPSLQHGVEFSAHHGQLLLRVVQLLPSGVHLQGRGGVMAASHCACAPCAVLAGRRCRTWPLNPWASACASCSCRRQPAFSCASLLAASRSSCTAGREFNLPGGRGRAGPHPRLHAHLAQPRCFKRRVFVLRSQALQLGGGI